MNTQASLFYIKAVVLYSYLWVSDIVEYYFKYLILSLPAYVFSSPVFTIKQLTEDSDSDSDDSNLSIIDYDILVCQLIFVFHTNKEPPTMTSRAYHAGNLKPFINERGSFFLQELEQYYPHLDTIILRYVKVPHGEPDTESNNLKVKVIDVKKRYDIRNDKSCKMGVVL